MKYLVLVAIAFMITACSNSDSSDGISDLNASQKAALAELNGASFKWGVQQWKNYL